MGRRQFQFNELVCDLTKLDDGGAKVQDPLEEVNLGGEGAKCPKVIFVSQILSQDFKISLIGLLKQYKDCYALGLSRDGGLDRS